MEINAQLCGHRNAKQKIQYLLKVKDEKEDLKKEKTRLESIVKSLAANSPGVFAEARSDKSTSCHKSISTPTSDSNDRSFLNYSLSPGDSTMLSLAPTQGSPPTRAAPCTPGACMLDTEEAACPLALGTHELTCEETRPEHTPPKNGAPTSVCARRLTGVSVSVSISAKARGTLAKATARAEDAAAAAAGYKLHTAKLTQPRSPRLHTAQRRALASM